MQQEMVVLEGKVFTVDLQSMLGSTSYGWCLAGLPEGIILEGIQVIRTAPGIAPVIQRFHFGVSSAKAVEAELTFVLACSFQPEEIAKEEKISLTIIPHNSDEYITYNENLRQKEAENSANAIIPYGVQFTREAAQAQLPYGMIYNQNAFNNDFSPMVMYGVKSPGFPYTECGLPGTDAEPFIRNSNARPDARMAYGYPQDTLMKYGYPCGVQDAGMKYGYPCSTQDTMMKYGYPCGVQDTMMKYGYPCGVQDAGMKYGYFCKQDEPFIVKYGYPCC